MVRLDWEVGGGGGGGDGAVGVEGEEDEESAEAVAAEAARRRAAMMEADKLDPFCGLMKKFL